VTRVYGMGDWLVALTYRVWLICSALATVMGRWRGCTAQPWDHPLTHRGAHGCQTSPLLAARARHARAAPALHSPHHVGRGRRHPPSQLPTHTIARPDPPLVRSQAERSQAVALPHSLPPQAPRHTRPCSRLEGPCTGGPIKALGEWEGLETARRQDKRERRGERCWGGGRACTCAHHQAGTQATWAGQEGTHTGPSSPSKTMISLACSCLVMKCVYAGVSVARFVRVCMDGCVYL
jgi:hypothetical protein